MQKFKRLRMKMFEAELKQKDLAELLDISQSSLCSRMAGRTDFTVSDIYKIIKILKIPRQEALDYFPPEKEVK